MLTIFCCPKPFLGKSNVIQRNAIKSWLLLRPQPEIIIIGNEEGAEETSRELGLRHIPDVECNEFGTPLVNSVFRRAQEQATHDTLCYVNADIILTSEFIRSFLSVKNKIAEFIIVGRRRDVEINEPLNFKMNDWEDRLKSYTLKDGSIHAATGIDYFIFPKGTYSDIPTFAIGRTIWDGWLIYYARSRGIPVIDASTSIWAIHQNHEYPLRLGGKDGIWKGDEAKRNFELSEVSFYNISNATHRLKNNVLHKRHIYLCLEPFLLPLKRLKQNRY